MSCKFFLVRTYDYIRNSCLWLLVLGCFIIIYLQCPCLIDFMNYLIHATPIHPSLYLQYLFLLFTIAIIIAAILLLLLLFHYYHHYETVATDKPLWARLFPGAAELITHLLRLINILWLSLCRNNKFGFYFPRRLLRSPILVGYQASGGDSRLRQGAGKSFWTLPISGRQQRRLAICFWKKWSDRRVFLIEENILAEGKRQEVDQGGSPPGGAGQGLAAPPLGVDGPWPPPSHLRTSSHV
jgi:hypothetical protein